MNNLFGDDEQKKIVKKQKRSRKRKGDGTSKMSEPKSFEVALAELEELVAKLDTGDVPLEESVKIFERAQFLAKWCQDKLDKIEGKLKLLVPNSSGGFDAQPIDDLND